MNIFLREIKATRKSLLIWIVVMGLLILIAASKFSAFAGDPEMLKILDSIPPAMLEVMNANAFNLTTIIGFYGLMFLYFGLMGAIAAAMWGSDSISKEERDKTVEFSLVLPVSRSRVVTAKLLAALVNCLVFVLVTWGMAIVSVQNYQPDQDFYAFLRLEMLAMFLIELIFLAIGLLLSCGLKNHKIVSSMAVGIILVTYFFSIIVKMNKDFAFLKNFSPFYYYDAGEMYRNGHLNGMYVGFSVAIVMVCVITAYWMYNKRDLYTP